LEFRGPDFTTPIVLAPENNTRTDLENQFAEAPQAAVRKSSKFCLGIKDFRPAFPRVSQLDNRELTALRNCGHPAIDLACHVRPTALSAVSDTMVSHASRAATGSYDASAIKN
jgi:hypothetical protein